MNLGTRMTKLRVARRESLQQVADAVGVSKVHIWELEKGRSDNPSMALVTRLADHFGVSVSSLIDAQTNEADQRPEMARMNRLAGKLDADDVAIVEDMMRAMIKRRDQAKKRP